MTQIPHTEPALILSAAVVVSIYIDLIAHKDAKEISLKDAALWTLFWIALSFGFYGYIYFRFDPEHASLFLAGWALEKALSVDNLMVFIIIFKAFWIESALQHRILYYGILGAIVFRLIFVLIGSAALHVMGPWADLIFGLIVGFTAYKMLTAGEDAKDHDYQKHSVIVWAERWMPVVAKLDGKKFFISKARVEELKAADPSISVSKPNAAWHVTPAFIVLLLVEWSDLMFAFDSVPAVIAVTREPVLVYSAMLFAILGLRSLYFVLEALTHYLQYLAKAVIGLLIFITFKLFLHAANELLHWPGIHISPGQSLAIIGLVLLAGVVASLVLPKPKVHPKTASTSG